MTEFQAAASSAALPAEFSPRTIEITRADLRDYAEASGDHNPIHLDDAAARALGLDGVIAHGMLTWARVLGRIAEWAGGAERVRSSQVRFAAPVPVPEDAPAVLEISARVGEAADETGDEAGDEAGERRLALTVTCGGKKIYGKAIVFVR